MILIVGGAGCIGSCMNKVLARDCKSLIPDDCSTEKKELDKRGEPAEGPSYEGDSPVIVADSVRVRKILKWKPKYPELKVINEIVWKWD